MLVQLIDELLRARIPGHQLQELPGISGRGLEGTPVALGGGEGIEQLAVGGVEAMGFFQHFDGALGGSGAVQSDGVNVSVARLVRP